LEIGTKIFELVSQEIVLMHTYVTSCKAAYDGWSE